MNRKFFSICLLVLITAIALLPGSAYAAQDVVRLGSDIYVNQGQTMDQVIVVGGNASIDGHTDNVVAIGGNVYASQTAMTDNIIVVGGTVTIDGTVNGDLVVVGGTVTLSGNAVIQQDIILFTSTLNKAETTIIHGDIVNQNMHHLSDVIGYHMPFLQQHAPNLFWGLWAWFSIAGGLLVLAFGWLLGILFPNHTKSVARTLKGETLKAFAIGLLIKFLAIPVAIALAITILGIPLIFVLFAAIWIAQYFGLAALGYLISDKLTKQLDKSMGFGLMLFIGLLIIALVKAVPIGGSLIYFVLKCLGLGAVILSRFGTKQTVPQHPTDDSSLIKGD